VAQLPLETHNPVDVAVDEAGRAAQGTVQWLLEKNVDKDVMPTTGNDMRFFVCGEEGFRSIAADLMGAQGTVDICCWGFDPGMEIWRGSESPAGIGVPTFQGKPLPTKPAAGGWPRGIVYGALLEEITQRKDNPVTVRLLIWFDPRGSRKQNSMPGFTDIPVSGWTSPIQKKVQQRPPYANSERTQWCIDWWNRNLPDGESKGSGILTKNQRLRIVLRGISNKDVKKLLAANIEEEDAPSTHSDDGDFYYVDEQNLLEDYPTHHQKPILIDYAHPYDGKNATGYVMGLNSVTDYWDRTAHEIDDPLREAWDQWYVDDEHKHERETQDPNGPLSTAPYRHVNPYQDYACKITGKALKRLHQNFERGWNLFAPPAWQTTELKELPSGIPSLPDDPAYKVQIVRTQPHEQEKTIKSLYFQASSYARNYIYMENQYFFYPEFARHLKRERKKFQDKWAQLSNKPQQNAPILHLFVVTPHPQDPGMVPRTYDTMAELGHGDAWKDQDALSKAGKTPQKYRDKNGKNTFHPQSLQELQDTIGLKVSIARLRTSGVVGDQMAYREIYIHSKLMLIDDVFVTIGSANMNQRSMSADSEINFGATGQRWASGLRERVFSLLSGNATPGSGDRKKIPEVYDAWERRMKDNRSIQKTGKEKMDGFILPFMDSRANTILHAQIDLPSSSDVPRTV
jgi:phosphatidylserine/phosphatidylglycerophosphate/cardiolipin synthase-like enzyme